MLLIGISDSWYFFLVSFRVGHHSVMKLQWRTGTTTQSILGEWTPTVVFGCLQCDVSHLGEGGVTSWCCSGWQYRYRSLGVVPLASYWVGTWRSRGWDRRTYRTNQRILGSSELTPWSLWSWGSIGWSVNPLWMQVGLPRWPRRSFGILLWHWQLWWLLRWVWWFVCVPSGEEIY